MSEPTLNELLECALCGATSIDVQVGLAWYADGRGVQDINRCTDTAACQGRVEARGGSWPLRRSGDVAA